MSDKTNFVQAGHMISEGKSVTDIHKSTGVPLSTLYRYVSNGIPRRPGVSGRLPTSGSESRVSITLSPGGKERLDQLAAEQGRSRSEIVEEAIKHKAPRVMRLAAD